MAKKQHQHQPPRRAPAPAPAPSQPTSPSSPGGAPTVPAALRGRVAAIVGEHLAVHGSATYVGLAKAVRAARQAGKVDITNGQVDVALQQLLGAGELVQDGKAIRHSGREPSAATSPVPGLTASQFAAVRAHALYMLDNVLPRIGPLEALVPAEDHDDFPRDTYPGKAMEAAVRYLLETGDLIGQTCPPLATTPAHVAKHRAERPSRVAWWRDHLGLPAAEAEALADIEAELVEELRYFGPDELADRYPAYNFTDPEWGLLTVGACLTCDCLIDGGHVAGLWISDNEAYRDHWENPIYHMPLTRVPASIGDLGHLRYLHLFCDCGFDSIPASIGRLARLEVLVIGSPVDDGLLVPISGLSHLRTLHLVGCGPLPESFGSHLAALEHLRLDHCGLARLPESFGDLRSLRDLDLSSNRLAALPESFGRLAALERLDLSRNKLAALPESFGRLAALEHLDLSFNQLAALPESFGRLASLAKLEAQNNPLAALPESFGSLAALETLDLENCRLASLPASFGNLLHLREINLNRNHLPRLPETFGSLLELRHLILDNNFLCELPLNFGNLVKLEELGCGHNALATLPDSFGDLTSLGRLILNDNKFKVFPACITRLAKLRALFLDENDISTLPENIHALVSLEYLSLTNAPITSLPDTLADLPVLQKVRLSDEVVVLLALPPRLKLIDRNDEYPGRVIIRAARS